MLKKCNSTERFHMQKFFNSQHFRSLKAPIFYSSSRSKHLMRFSTLYQIHWCTAWSCKLTRYEIGALHKTFWCSCRFYLIIHLTVSTVLSAEVLFPRHVLRLKISLKIFLKTTKFLFKIVEISSLLFWIFNCTHTNYY